MLSLRDLHDSSRRLRICTYALTPLKNMVLGLLSLAGTIPMAATSVLSLQDKAEQKRENGVRAEWKTEKCNMRCRATARTPEDRKKMFEDSRLVLLDGRLFVQLSTYSGNPNHPFSGYYLPYPDSNFDGLVSTVSDNPPQLNWIYLDRRTFQIRHGLRVEAEKNGVTGPWGGRVCADGEIRLLMHNWEGFIAVETEEQGMWGLYFDRYDDGLKGKVTGDQRTVEVEVIREEMKW